MRTIAKIHELLDELEHSTADDMEEQDLDFKKWNTGSLKDAVSIVIEMSICMANGGGGTVVFGVNDRTIGREDAIIGVPLEIDINRLKKAVYDSTDPKLMPIFEEMSVPEGTGRLLVMQVYSGLPPYTDTSGRGKIRIGKNCQPLTGTLRRRIMVETGENDFTSEPISEPPLELISASAIEHLRNAARQEKAPEDLLRLADMEFLDVLGLIHQGRLTRAAVILAGHEAALKKYVPGYVWTHLRMQTDTKYSDRADGSDALPIAINRLTDRIMADNPITTIEYGLYHFEYRVYPEIALREVLLNAFCHTEFRMQSPIIVKQYPDRLEFSNPGGFIGGITPENILHHTPVPRNPCLVAALTKLRLINRSNLGISRMYEAMLIEGKQPPDISEVGESVIITFHRQEVSSSFRSFIAEESRYGRLLNVDQLLILHYLLEHVELDTATTARICQRNEEIARNILFRMETKLNYLERGGSGRGTYWTLRSDIHRRIAAPGHPERDKRIDWETAKTRVLSILKQRAKHEEMGLRNAEVRQITRLDRQQVNRLIHELEAEGQVTMNGYGRGARYNYIG